MTLIENIRATPVPRHASRRLSPERMQSGGVQWRVPLHPQAAASEWLPGQQHATVLHLSEIMNGSARTPITLTRLL